MGKTFHKLYGSELPSGNQSESELKQLSKLYIHHTKLVGNQIDGFRKLVEKLDQNPSDNQTRVAARKAANTYLKSLSGRFIAAMDENKKRAKDDRLSLSNCLALAKEVKAHKQCDETVRIYEKVKSSGGIRVIHDFGLRHRTAQQMVRTLLNCRVKPRDWQYTFEGVPAAIRRIKELPVKSETWAVKLDIKDFYGHFTHSGLKKLLWDIPDSVVKATLLSKGNAFTPYGNVSSPETLSQEARRGVAQGSVASPVLAVLAVSQINWEPHPEVECINYADDFLLVSPSKTALEDSTLALDASVKTQLPGGNFFLKEPVLYQFGGAVEFLGHYLFMDKGTLAADACASALERFRGRIDELENRAMQSLDELQAAPSEIAHARLMRRLTSLNWYVQSWLSSFSECHPVSLSAYREDGMFKLVSVCDAAGIPLQDVIDQSPRTISGMSYGEVDDSFDKYS